MKKLTLNITAPVILPVISIMAFTFSTCKNRNQYQFNRPQGSFNVIGAYRNDGACSSMQ